MPGTGAPWRASPGHRRSKTVLLFRLVRDLGSLFLGGEQEKEQISSTRELVDYCLSSMGGLKDEHFAVIYLNARNKIIRVETIQEGIVNQAVVYPRKVLEKALAHKASAIILVHDHHLGACPSLRCGHPPDARFTDARGSQSGNFN